MLIIGGSYSLASVLRGAFPRISWNGPGTIGRWLVAAAAGAPVVSLLHRA